MRGRICGLAATVAWRYGLRRARDVACAALRSPAPRHGAPWVLSPAALCAQARHQSSAAERRFHCSVCKKAFRLEMAAKLHLQQVHSGEGSVEAGAGPGQNEEQAAQTPVGVFRNAPPQAPTVVTQVVPDSQDRGARREKPAPKPLHEAEREVPGLVMEKMLGVWDDMGVKRIGNQFVHSTMVMRVFAARPSDSGEPLYGAMNPEGENPFASAQADAGTAGAGAAEDKTNIYSVDLNDAFAMACGDSFGPLRPSACPNPFFRKPLKDGSKAAAKQELAEMQTAPVTPFGQLPMFGQTPTSPAPASLPGAPSSASTAAPASSAAGAPTVVSSPFDADVSDSPFAGTAESPFAGQGYSPFAAEVEPAAATDADASAHDDADAGAAAATAAAAAVAAAPSSDPASPFAAAASALPPSPFAASPFAASPFATTEGAASAVGSFAAVDPAAFAMPSSSAVGVTSASTPAPEAAHTCDDCGRRFSTFSGVRQHAKVKHGKLLEAKQEAKGKRELPEMPAFIPSPVDLTMTSPFGSSSVQTAWTEVELTPYAQSVSNITVAGRLLDVETAPDGALVLAVYVRCWDDTEPEVIPVRCTADAARPVGRLQRGDVVFACGSLRVLPLEDKKSQKGYVSPVVHVSLPAGVLVRVV